MYTSVLLEIRETLKKGLKYEKEPEHRIFVKRKHRAMDIILDICGLPYIMEVLL